MLCPGPVRPERCEGCQTGQLGKQRPLMLGFMPWHPRQAGAFPGGGGLKKKSGCKPSIPLRGKRAGSEAFLAVGPPHQRAARRGVQDKQAQQPYRVNCRRELMRRGVKKKKMLQLLQREGNGGEWRGVMAQRVREPGTDRHSRQPGPSSGNTQGLMSLIVC